MLGTLWDWFIHAAQATNLDTTGVYKERLGIIDGLDKAANAVGYKPAQTLTDVASELIKIFLSLLGIIFIGMILFAGYNWMTAMGDKEKVTRAKDTLVSALIGLILIIAAWSITNFVLTSLGTV